MIEEYGPERDRELRQESQEAHRVFKLLKNELVEADELDATEFGLLYLHYPELLPDVERGAV